MYQFTDTTIEFAGAMYPVDDWQSASSRPRITDKMHHLLLGEGLCIRVTDDRGLYWLGDLSVIDEDVVEFKFLSPIAFSRAFESMRLWDFGRAYLDLDMDITGSIKKAAEVLYVVNISSDVKQSVTEIIGLLLLRIKKAYFPTSWRQFESLQHYAQNPTVYELLLDEYMQYTCGVFRSGGESIDEAQIAKFDLIHELVGPLAGKSHLDIGCGWGGMMAYFETKFGTNSVGNTNCLQQMKYAQNRYGSKIILGDFSELRHCDRKFDVITIVGMMEHLTPELQSMLFELIHQILNEDGRVYLQCIAKPDCWIGGDAYRLVQNDIFSGHYLEKAAVIESKMHKWGFSILNDQMEFASDYGHTAARWVENIQKNETRLKSIFGIRCDKDGERKYRLYLGYLAMASVQFLDGRGSLRRYALKKS